jgi:uncharacterized protein YndB with AHSA1/START domain
VRVEESVEIRRSPEDVWDVIADPANDPRWCPKVKDVKALGERRWRVLHKPVPLRPVVELTLEVREATPPTRLTLRQEDDQSIFDVEYRLSDRDGSTHFTQVSEFEWKRLPRLLHGFFARGVRRDVRVQLRALKRLLET